MRIRALRPPSSVALLVLALLMAGQPAVFLYLKSLGGDVPAALYRMMTPFFFIAILLALWGTRDLVRLMRFGRWELECPEAGGVFGQPLKVQLLPQRIVTPNSEIACRLRCTRADAFGPAGKRGNSLETTTQWETNWSVRASTIYPRIGLDLTIPVPDEGTGTRRDKRTGAGIEWQLFVQIPTERMSDEPMFVIPIGRAAGLHRR